MNIVIWSLLVVAAMRPQWVGAPVETQVQGRDLLLAVDLSRSMGERDFNMNGQPVSRLALVKAVASDFIGRRDGDRVAGTGCRVPRKESAGELNAPVPPTLPESGRPVHGPPQGKVFGTADPEVVAGVEDQTLR